MSDQDFQNLAIALALGLLVGLQREWAQKPLAGIRTYPLVALLGAVCGILGRSYGSWLPAMGMVGVLLLVVVGSAFRDWSRSRFGSGITTEISLLLTYVVGLMLATGHRVGAASVTGVMLVLLQFKGPLHSVVGRMEREELQALARLALIGMVILPLMPDRSWGPYDVINPFRIWLMVVLIVGISLVAYLVSRILGTRSGSVAAGLLGGLISSTATTVSTATSAKDAAAKGSGGAASGEGGTEAKPGAALTGATLIIMLASTVVFLRVTIELVLVARDQLSAMLPPLLFMMAVMAVIAAADFWRGKDRIAGAAAATGPPSGLSTAVTFGLLYAVILLAVAGAKQYLPEGWLYAVAAISGLTDMDAITLSTGQLVASGKLDAATGWRLILVGGLSNLVFKGVMVGILGPRALLKRVGVLFGIALIVGVVVIVAWPG